MTNDEKHRVEFHIWYVIRDILDSNDMETVSNSFFFCLFFYRN